MLRSKRPAGRRDRPVRSPDSPGTARCFRFSYCYGATTANTRPREELRLSILIYSSISISPCNQISSPTDFGRAILFSMFFQIPAQTHRVLSLIAMRSHPFLIPPCRILSIHTRSFFCSDSDNHCNFCPTMVLFRLGRCLSRNTTKTHPFIPATSTSCQLQVA